MILNTNPNLILLQTSLLTPNYQGPGRWTIFIPETKKSFLAIGKDEFPKIIEILCYFSQADKTLADYEDAGYTISGEELRLLLERKLLFSQGLIKSPVSFLRSYKLATYNYPFNDYFNAQWSEFDYQQMEQYKKISLRPENVEKIDGQIFSLEDVPKNLKNALKLTFSEIERVSRDDGTYWIRRTSPSGGARHPTDGYVYFPRHQFNIPEGFYSYNHENHVLIAIPNVDFEIDKNCLIAFVIKTHVERAMWRYREIRAFRPMLIDAGHVMETLSQLLNLANLSVDIILGDSKKNDLQWIEDPTIAILQVYESEADVRGSKHNDVEKITCGKFYQTNPSLFFMLENGNLKAHTLWPEHSSISISYHEFRLINHSLFSRRDDRENEADKLPELFKVSKTRITEFIKKNLLLEKSLAKNVYQKVYLWSRYNWYLSYLAFLAISKPNNLVSCYKTSTSSDQLEKVLLSRKSTRIFTTEKVTQKDLIKILTYSIEITEQISIETSIIIAVFFVADLEPGLYRFEFQSKSLIKLKKVLRQDEIRRMTIGQRPAGSGAATIWLFSHTKNEEDYLKAIVILGMIGQRICLQSTALGIGVFLTPAICDELTHQILQVETPLDKITYTFTIGYGQKI